MQIVFISGLYALMGNSVVRYTWTNYLQPDTNVADVAKVNVLAQQSLNQSTVHPNMF